MTVIVVDGVEVELTPEEAEDLAAMKQSIQESIAAEKASAPYTLPKMLLWTRLSDSQAEAVETAMATQPARMRGIWNSATEVRSDSEFFGTLETFLTAVIGADHTAELLSPE